MPAESASQPPAAEGIELRAGRRVASFAVAEESRAGFDRHYPAHLVDQRRLPTPEAMSE